MAYIAEMLVAPKEAEVIGFAILSMHQSLEGDVVNPILEKYNLTAEALTADGWYPLQILYDVYVEILQNEGGPTAMTAMGKAVAEPLLASSNAETLNDFFDGEVHKIVRSSLRNLPDDYGYQITQTGPQAYEVFNNTGTPNEFIYGYLWEVMRLMAPKGEAFRVIPSKNFGLGSDPSCGATFTVSWG